MGLNTVVFSLVFVMLGVTFAVDTPTPNAQPTYPTVDLNIYEQNDLLIRYLLALRYAQLQNYYSNYDPYYTYNTNNNKVPTRFQPDPVTASPPKKENCKQIGEPCVYHEDCCSNACLTYLARCVTG